MPQFQFAAIFKIERNERKAVLWSFAYFFFLLCSYYILRPIRDTMGISGGIDKLPWAFSATFIVTLIAVPAFGAATRQLKRHLLLPSVYYFFIANLLIFYFLFHQDIPRPYVAYTFFVWVSVFNLFVVSVFWSFMADIFSNNQARRLFGFIAAGGSAGALLGPSLTAMLVQPLGPINLLLISAAFLLLANICIGQLLRLGQHANDSQPEHQSKDITLRGSDAAIGGGIMAGIRLLLSSPYLMGISAYLLLSTLMATFLYFEQAYIVRDAFADDAQRTRVFALIDLAVNALTIGLQLFFTSRMVLKFGLATVLALLPGLLLFGFAILGAMPVLAVLIAIQILRRSGNYAIAKPAREILFTVISREEKYKAKNVIDTVIYRGGDAIAAWLFTGLQMAGLGLAAIAILAIPVAALAVACGLWLGRTQERLRTNQG